MSSVRIESERDLKNFLKILLEERLLDTRLDEGHHEDHQSETVSAINRGLKMYRSSIDEQEEEEEESPKPEEAEEAEEAEETEEPEEEEGGEAEEEEVSDETEEIPQDITYYRIRDEINNIRAAPSLKGDEPKQDMEQWLSRLEDREKILLYTFLDTLGKIMHGKVTGSDALDPGDLPDIEPSGEESEESEPEPRRQAPAERGGGERSPGEDTSPPIRVGGSQELSEIRNRIRSLMR